MSEQTMTTTNPRTPTSSGREHEGGSVAPTGDNPLVTSQGRTSISDSVVEKIAGIACREVPGVHDMGKGAARALGSIREMLPVGSSSISQGVAVEVGERQAAIDIDIVVDYGVSIPDIGQSVRKNVMQRVQRMTGLEVTEVNITVNDIYVPGEPPKEEQEPRVQ